MNYERAARQIYESIGGEENLVSVTHCAVRLRIAVAYNEKCDLESLKGVEGAKGVFQASRQLQIVFEPENVGRMYEEFLRIADKNKERQKKEKISENLLEKFSNSAIINRIKNISRGKIVPKK